MNMLLGQNIIIFVLPVVALCYYLHTNIDI